MTNTFVFNQQVSLKNVDQLGDLILNESGAQGLIYLRDVAEIKRGYVEVPSNIITFNGDLALNLGVSFAQGVNVVEVGKRFDRRLAELKIPATCWCEHFRNLQPTKRGRQIS
ncbi:efflux RND transporter permease subunit [Vibrio sinaloensis]|nr:efflux RND transporter permease subunit [Vibrio sinaloensis]